MVEVFVYHVWATKIARLLLPCCLWNVFLFASIAIPSLTAGKNLLLFLLPHILTKYNYCGSRRMGNLRLSLDTHRSRNRGEKEWIFLRAALIETKEPGGMELLIIKIFFLFPKYLASLSFINTTKLVCHGNSKDLGIFTWFSYHLSPKMSPGQQWDYLNPESMGKKSSFFPF